MPNQPKAGVLSGKTGGIKHKWWLLGGIGVGGLGYLYYRKNAMTAAPTAVDPTAPTDPVTDTGYDPYAGYDSGYGTGYGGAYSSGGGSGTNDPTFAQAAAVEAQAAADSATALGDIAGSLSDANAPAETNEQWMHDAIHALMAHGYTKAAATAAVTAYLAGAPMTQKQIHTVESAFGRVGPPPQSAPRVHATPVPKQPKKDARHPAHKQAAKKKHHHHAHH